jgi:hypothetical protein
MNILSLINQYLDNFLHYKTKAATVFRQEQCSSRTRIRHPDSGTKQGPCVGGFDARWVAGNSNRNPRDVVDGRVTVRGCAFFTCFQVKACLESRASTQFSCREKSGCRDIHSRLISHEWSNTWSPFFLPYFCFWKQLVLLYNCSFNDHIPNYQPYIYPNCTKNLIYLQILPPFLSRCL